MSRVVINPEWKKKAKKAVVDGNEKFKMSRQIGRSTERAGAVVHALIIEYQANTALGTAAGAHEIKPTEKFVAA